MILCYFLLMPCFGNEGIPKHVYSDISEYLLEKYMWTCEEFIIGKEYYNAGELDEYRILLRVTHRDDLLEYSSKPSNKSLSVEYDLKNREIISALGYQ